MTVPRTDTPRVSFPSRDVSVNMTLELGLANLSLAVPDIIEILILELPGLLATSIVFSPDRIAELSIKYENQTRRARSVVLSNFDIDAPRKNGTGQRFHFHF